ncbi:PfkB family carbohydrate kinase [Streptomyces albicerus]|uniref:PfkB family carbohydrate kinase n=1 Tax=Streptomyces albicerus TaxID=2569859 RepID=UPI001CED5307|nr:PfkB family carbohydrate kinase [Streptomyces albicerus]
MRLTGARKAAAEVGDHRITVPTKRASRLVDTTGAGDTLVGTPAAAPSRGGELAAAVHAATVESAAASAVSRPGARHPSDDLAVSELAGTAR